MDMFSDSLRTITLFDEMLQTLLLTVAPELVGYRFFLCSNLDTKLLCLGLKVAERFELIYEIEAAVITEIFHLTGIPVVKYAESVTGIMELDDLGSGVRDESHEATRSCIWPHNDSKSYRRWDGFVVYFEDTEMNGLCRITGDSKGEWWSRDDANPVDVYLVEITRSVLESDEVLIGFSQEVFPMYADMLMVYRNIRSRYV